MENIPTHGVVGGWATERSRTSVAARGQMLEWLGVPRGALCLRRGTAAPLFAGPWPHCPRGARTVAPLFRHWPLLCAQDRAGLVQSRPHGTSCLAMRWDAHYFLY